MTTPETTPSAVQLSETPTQAPAWNGELESLDSQPWYSAIPEEHRPAFRTGYETKLKAYDSGYQSKYREVAEGRKAWEAEKAAQEEAMRNREAEIQKLLYGEGDPAAEWKEKHEAAKAEATSWKTKYEEVTKAQADQVVSALLDDAEKNLPDIFRDDKLWDRYEGLILAGVPRDEAVAMVRAIAPQAAPPSKAERALDVRSSPQTTPYSNYSSWAAAKEAYRRS